MLAFVRGQVPSFMRDRLWDRYYDSDDPRVFLSQALSFFWNIKNWHGYGKDFKGQVGSFSSDGVSSAQIAAGLKLMESWFKRNRGKLQDAWDACVAEASKGGKVHIPSAEEQAAW